MTGMSAVKALLQHAARTLLLSALCVAAPALAATDGNTATSSSGNFSVSIAVLPQNGREVQIVGLQDFNMPATQASQFEQYVTTYTQACLNMTRPGNVVVSFNQTGRARDDFQLSDGAGRFVQASFAVSTQLGISFGTEPGVWVTPADSPETCQVGRASEGHFMILTAIVPPGNASAGSLSGQFSVTIAPQG